MVLRMSVQIIYGGEYQGHGPDEFLTLKDEAVPQIIVTDYTLTPPPTQSYWQLVNPKVPVGADRCNSLTSVGYDNTSDDYKTIATAYK